MSKRVDRGFGGVGGFSTGARRRILWSPLGWLRQVEDRKDITVNVLQKDRHQEGPC